MLPKAIKPMEPVLTNEPPEGDNFLHSVKWDGVRQIVYLGRDNFRIHNRKIRDRTEIYPELQSVREMTSGTGFVFDGEVIALDERGRPNFQRVMRRDNCKTAESVRRAQQEVSIFYMIFDLLYYKGENIMEFPLVERLALLEEVLPNPSPPIQVVQHLSTGRELYVRTGELELEGVVSKEASSHYLPGAKSKMWMKSKHFKDMEVVVGGFTVKNGFLNSLSVGAYGQDGRLHYLGNVATGLSHSELKTLDSQLRTSIQSNSPFANYNQGKSAQYWTTPLLTLKVKYLEITQDGYLRHPVVLGFVSVDPLECRLVPEKTVMKQE